MPRFDLLMAFNSKDSKFIFKLRDECNMFNMVEKARSRSTVAWSDITGAASMSSKPLVKPSVDETANALCLKEAKKQFKPKLDGIASWESFLYLVGSNREVREWYNGYKASVMVESSMPEWLRLKEGGRDNFMAASASLAEVRDGDKARQRQVDAAALALKNVVRTTTQSKLAALRALPPTAVILSLTVNDLPLDRQAVVAAGASVEERGKLADAQLAAYQTKLYDDWVANPASFVNPFLAPAP